MGQLLLQNQARQLALAQEEKRTPPPARKAPQAWSIQADDDTPKPRPNSGPKAVPKARLQRDLLAMSAEKTTILNQVCPNCHSCHLC